MFEAHASLDAPPSPPRFHVSTRKPTVLESTGLLQSLRPCVQEVVSHAQKMANSAVKTEHAVQNIWVGKSSPNLRTPPRNREQAHLKETDLGGGVESSGWTSKKFIVRSC
mmetsp:Transcript_1752/g.3780  ORF Transcript_1752/g.3780 Transcript_1752/m.3780 type:complete len:110 (-) Transcript_1752:99-428(-)